MSLANQHIQPQNLKFLNKLHHLYSKKGSQTSMSSYTQQKNQQNLSFLNPIRNEYIALEKKWGTVQEELKFILIPFKDSLKKLLQGVNDENKFYRMLQIMRKEELLSEISEQFNQKMVKQNFALKKQVEKHKQALAYLSKLESQNKQSPKKQKQRNQNQNPTGQKIDSTCSLPQRIYAQARLLNQTEFVDWCDKIIMKNRIVITDLKRQLSTKKTLSKSGSAFSSHQRSLSLIENKKRSDNDSDFCDKHNLVIDKIQHLSPLIQSKLFESIKHEIISDLVSLKLEKLTCPNFCCSIQKQKFFGDKNQPFKPQSTKKSMTWSISKNEPEVYRDKRTEEYFNRYYKHPAFKLNQIKSVEQTKAEEMKRLQNQYHKMLEHRNKQRYAC